MIQLSSAISRTEKYHVTYVCTHPYISHSRLLLIVFRSFYIFKYCIQYKRFVRGGGEAVDVW